MADRRGQMREGVSEAASLEPTEATEPGTEPGETTRPSRLAPRSDEPRSGDGDGSHPERASLELDRLIHERMRLGIVSALAVNDSLSFSDLKGLLKTSDGNLSVHARKLEEAGYLECEKTFKGRRPRTAYRLTTAGRGALERYLGHMEAIIEATRRP